MEIIGIIFGGLRSLNDIYERHLQNQRKFTKSNNKCCEKWNLLTEFRNGISMK